MGEQRSPDPGNGLVRYLRLPRHIQLENLGDHEHIDLIYFCHAQDGEPKFSPQEHEQMRWFTLRELRSCEIPEEVRDTGTLAIQEVGLS